MTDQTDQAGSSATPAAAPEGAAAGAENIVHLSPDMLPGGAAPKSGDRLTFVVTGDADEEGDIPGYFEGAPAGKDDSEAAWADDFRKQMSPTAPQEGAA